MLAWSPDVTQHYRKVGTRKAQAISKVCFAGAVEMSGGKIVKAGVAYGSVGPVVAVHKA